MENNQLITERIRKSDEGDYSRYLLGYYIKRSKTNEDHFDLFSPDDKYVFSMDRETYQYFSYNMAEDFVSKFYKSEPRSIKTFDKVTCKPGTKEYDKSSEGYKNYKKYFNARITRLSTVGIRKNLSMKERQQKDKVSDSDIKYFVDRFGGQYDIDYKTYQADSKIRQQFYPRILQYRKSMIDDLNDIEVDVEDGTSLEDIAKLAKSHTIDDTYVKGQNNGKELEDDIANTMNKVLDPNDKSIPGKKITVSPETRSNEKFQKALKDLSLSMDDKLLDAERSGESRNDLSDVKVDWNTENIRKLPDNYKKFFIEAKLDYTSAPVTHFFVDIVDGHIRPKPNGSIKRAADNSDHSEEYTEFDEYMASQNAVTGILQKSPELNEFFQRYDEAVKKMNEIKKPKGIDFSVKSTRTFPKDLKELASICDEYIVYYKNQYEKYLGQLMEIGNVDENMKNETINAFRSHLVQFQTADDDGLVNDKTIVSFFLRIKDDERFQEAKLIFLKMRNIHNKLTWIMESSGRSLDELNESDKALFMLWTFISPKMKKDLNSGELGFDIHEEDRGRRLLKYQTTDRGEIRILADVMKKYYRNLKDAAYVQIGSDTYYMDDKLDPLGIIQKYHLHDVSDSFEKIVIYLSVTKSLAINFTTYVKPRESQQNGNAFATNITGGNQIKEITY